MDAQRAVQVELTYGEVVVLHELLHRWEDDETIEGLPFVDPAERVALSNLSATLEPLFDEVFAAAEIFDAAVESARASLRAED